MRIKRNFLPFALVVIWLLFTVSLSGWWIIFALETVKELTELKHNGAAELLRHQKMLLAEGGFLFLMLFSGALALVYYIFRELKERESVKDFFTTFTHELKTPLASLRLQAEVLQEGIKDTSKIELLERLLSDINRLTLQLENSLYLANIRSRDLLIEKLLLSDLLNEARRLWPKIEILANADCIIHGDLRVMQSVVQNIAHNAWVHGHASKIEFIVTPSSQGVEIKITDNGEGFTGERSRLGERFRRFYSGSGSGVGLYLVREFLKRLGGKVGFPDVRNGFCVQLQLNGQVI